MKIKRMFAIMGVILLTCGVFTEASAVVNQEDCEVFLGGEGQADVMVCCGATYVMSGYHMSGGCLGANQGCSGSYANGCQ